jgi:predicted transcriptional regulator
MDKVQINVRNVPAELLKKAQEIAEKQDRPLSQVIRELLREWVAEQEQKLPTK